MPTPFLIREVLGRGMYRDAGRCLAELVRNGMVACMGERWEPASARIDISLVHNHPLAPKGESALVVLDHGHGMTDADLVRYFAYLGPSPEAARKDGGYGGASQKGIGRFATLALSEQAERDDCPYYLLSRTQDEGDIRYIKVTPELLCREAGIDGNRFIRPSATELGPLRNSVQGSFTAIVIPTPVLKSDAAIYEAVKWYLPREPSRMCQFFIGGKQMTPPALPKEGGAITATSEDLRYRAYIGSSDGKNGADDGIWFCDEATGFRVASCQDPKFRDRGLPEPLWYTDLSGDIFVPELLHRQDTARSTLEKDFTKSAEWRRLCLFLSVKVAPLLSDLIEHNPVTDDARKALEGIVELFDEVYGKAPAQSGKGGGGGGSGGGGGGGTGRKTRKRYERISVRGEVFELFLGRSLDEFTFAAVNARNPKQIEVNARGGYKALPRNLQAKQEHCLMQILNAVARSDVWNRDTFNAREVSQFANELRAELQVKRKA